MASGYISNTQGFKSLEILFTVVALSQIFSDTKSVSTSKVPNGSKVL